MQFKCKECNEDFTNKRSLHTHIKKHKLLLGDYYVKHFPRFDKLTGDPIGFKGFDQYFSSNFNNNANMIEWCGTAPQQEVKDFILEEFKQKVKEKDLKKAPSSIYLKTAGLPTIEIIKTVFGSYSALCAEVGLDVAFGARPDDEFFKDYSDADIFVDTRENHPLLFKNSTTMKLDFGDYSLTAKDYSYTHVERKSWQDFALTVTSGHKRFLRELERCKRAGCFLFIVVEANFLDIEDINYASYKRVNLDYVFHQMRDIESQYPETCQFVFSGSREDSMSLIPKILCLGKKLWRVDLQFFWEQHLKDHGLGKRKSKTTQTFRGYKRKTLSKRGILGGG